ncbi:MAG TPA: hypothetical protein VJ672_13360 [Gemmatimonadaceae bacterium]|nr:hypothetical protein [Gemmatimonadaceae bacterium]
MQRGVLGTEMLAPARVMDGVALAVVIGAWLLGTPALAQSAGAPSDTTPRTLAQAFAHARQALGRGDQNGARRALEIARKFVPNDGSVLVYLARAQALTGDPGDALRTLERLAIQGAVVDLAADTAFRSLRVAPYAIRFAAATRQLARASAPLVRSDTAFVLEDPDFIPEGIAHDPARDVFYVGSLVGGGVLRLMRDGSAVSFFSSTATAPPQVLGIRIDAPARRLWLAALFPDTAAPQFARGSGGWAALHAYDLESGELVARHPAPDSTRPHLLNDIALTPNGDVYVTDSEGAALFRLRAGSAALERVPIGSQSFTYPNGIAVTADGARVYVAHVEGLSVLDLRARNDTLMRVLAPPGEPTGGIDGLYACGTALYAIQSRFGFQQVTRFQLSADGRRITRSEALERRHPAYDAATTGALVAGAMFYIANAQLRRLASDNTLAPTDKPMRSVILRLPIRDSCNRTSGPARTR